MSTKKKITIGFKGPILGGSVSTAKSQCGKSNCACKEHIKNLHGTYYRWTGFILGKRTTKTITKKMAEECKRRIRNYRVLEKKIKKIVEEANDNAPWNEI
jgi:hypothetical protein